MLETKESGSAFDGLLFGTLMKHLEIEVSVNWTPMGYSMSNKSKFGGFDRYGITRSAAPILS